MTIERGAPGSDMLSFCNCRSDSEVFLRSGLQPFCSQTCPSTRSGWKEWSLKSEQEGDTVGFVQLNDISGLLRKPPNHDPVRFAEMARSPVAQLMKFAILGLAAILAAGPILVLLSFALLGFIVWTCLRIAYFGRQRTWEKTRELTRSVASVFIEPASCGAGYLGNAVERHALLGFQNAKYLSLAACLKARKNLRFIGTILLESIGGASVGALLGYLAYSRSGSSVLAVPIGSFIGCLLGVLLAVCRHKPISNSSVGQAN